MLRDWSGAFSDWMNILIRLWYQVWLWPLLSQRWNDMSLQSAALRFQDKPHIYSCLYLWSYFMAFMASSFYRMMFRPHHYFWSTKTITITVLTVYYLICPMYELLWIKAIVHLKYLSFVMLEWVLRSALNKSPQPSDSGEILERVTEYGLQDRLSNFFVSLFSCIDAILAYPLPLSQRGQWSGSGTQSRPLSWQEFMVSLRIMELSETLNFCGDPLLRPPCRGEAGRRLLPRLLKRIIKQ